MTIAINSGDGRPRWRPMMSTPPWTGETTGYLGNVGSNHEAIMTTHSYSADRTALLSVDPYNDFMSEGGKLYSLIKPTADESGMFDNLGRIIPAARASGIKIVIVPHHRADPHGHDYDGWQNLNMFMAANRNHKVFEVGTWGGEFHPEFGPKPGDVVAKEHWAQNGFVNTDLDLLLKQHGIQKVVLVGALANTCIEATGRYAMEVGYHVTLVTDATAAFSPDGMLAAKINAPTFAHAILTTEELLASLPAPVTP
jgi:nicotinamidase-related amidase